MKNYFVKTIRKFLSPRGYSISKCPSIPFTQLSVFDLAVTLLMKARNNEIRFLQVGANDGVYGDAISKYALKFPWRGILVEPQPEVFERLKRNYHGAIDRMIFENCAIGSAQRVSLELFRTRDSDQHDSYPSSVASFNKSAVAAQMQMDERELVSIVVPCVTIDSLLARHQWQMLDLLFIDTEGLDLEVLQSITLSKYKPLVIQFEHGHLSPADINSAVGYLTAHGYQILYGGYYVDTIAVHKSFWDVVNSQ